MQRTHRRTTGQASEPSRRWRCRRIATRLVAATVASCAVVTIAAGRAAAWKPSTHVYAADVALNDVLDDGLVTLDPANGSAPVTLAADPNVGPRCEWLSYLWQQAYEIAQRRTLVRPRYDAVV